LRDYANKEWGGLLSSLYLERWKAFADYEAGKLNMENVVEPNYYDIEVKWAADAKSIY